MRDVIRTQLVVGFAPRLVDGLLNAHAEAKRNYYLGGLRLSEVEGGRFCEAAFRMLQQITSGSFTPLGTPLNVDHLITLLANIPSGRQPDAIRLHIPRALRLVYDIRNNRDAAHLADGIDPNLQDATLVNSVLDWVLAEFIRLFHHVSANEAHQLVDSIVVRVAPVVQDFNGFLKVLNPDLRASDHCLVLLYQRGSEGATFKELSEWAQPTMREKLKRTLEGLNNTKAFVHFDGNRYYITHAGQNEVEVRHLIEPNYWV